MLVVIVALFVVFYVYVIHPLYRTKRECEHEHDHVYFLEYDISNTYILGQRCSTCDKFLLIEDLISETDALEISRRMKKIG
jgi:adenine/guanine phosphoribosyltransferase-like PRPP-binding protein